jgi:hypothetical protein
MDTCAHSPRPQRNTTLYAGTRLVLETLPRRGQLCPHSSCCSSMTRRRWSGLTAGGCPGTSQGGSSSSSNRSCSSRQCRALLQCTGLQHHPQQRSTISLQQWRCLDQHPAAPPASCQPRRLPPHWQPQAAGEACIAVIITKAKPVSG